MIESSMSRAGRVPGSPEGAGLPGRTEALAAARKFESFFVDILLKELSSDLGEGGFFGESAGSELQQGLFNTMLSQEITERGPGLGLAERLVEEWVRRGMVQGATDARAQKPEVWHV